MTSPAQAIIQSTFAMLLQDCPWGYSAPCPLTRAFIVRSPHRLSVESAWFWLELDVVVSWVRLLCACIFGLFLDNSHPLGSSAFLSDEKTCKEDNFGTCRMNQNTSLYGFLCKKLCVIFFVFVYFLWTLRFLGVMLHHINFYYMVML